VLPRKQKRLSLLKLKLSKILDGKAKQEAAEKLEEQTALLNAIKKRESAMSSRIHALKQSQQKLETSVGQLQTVINAPAAGAAAGALTQVGAVPGPAVRSAKANIRPTFMEVGSEADIAADMETEDELQSEESAEDELNFQADHEAEQE